MADVEPEMDDGQGDPLASINQRIGASVLIFALSSERVAADVEPSFPAWAALLWIVLVFLYEVIMVAVWGQTLGKMLLGIKLVSLADGGRLSVPAAVIRMLPRLATVLPDCHGLCVLQCCVHETQSGHLGPNGGQRGYPGSGSPHHHAVSSCLGVAARES